MADVCPQCGRPIPEEVCSFCSPHKPSSLSKKFGTVGAVLGLLLGLVSGMPEARGDLVYLAGYVTGWILIGAVLGFVTGFMAEGRKD